MREDLLSSHFTDIATLKKFKKINEYNEREYDIVTKEIKCRKVYKTNIVKNANNEDVVSTITIYTFEPVQDKDNIDGKDILEITQWKSLLDNQVVGYRIRI